MVLSYYIAFCMIALGITLSVWRKKLTLIAAITGGLCAGIIFTATGIGGIALLAAFFIMGVAATAHQWNSKQRHGLTDTPKGERTAGQVLANGGVAVIISVFILFDILNSFTGVLMMAGSLASAASDTVSSEMGNVYGRKFYNILSFRKATRGVNGGVSVEGTLAGVAASFLTALVYIAFTGWKPAHMLVIVIAGTIGNIADSVLGATLENKKLLTNNAVNFANTAIGAAVALLLYNLFDG